MKKFFSLYDLMYLIPIIITSVLTTAVTFTGNAVVAVIQIAFLVFGYELIYYIAKLYMPQPFVVLDLVKMLVALMLCYVIYLIPFLVLKSADIEIFDITLMMAAVSLGVLVLGGPVIMLMKKSKMKKKK